MKRQRFLIVDNPTAGTRTARRVAAVRAALVKAGVTVIDMPRGHGAPPPEEILRAARGADVDAVLAAGGDGTMRLVAEALVGTGLPAGLIPAGTGNVLAHEIGMPHGPEAIARVLMQDPAACIETHRANGAVFLLMAGVGMDGEIIARLDQRVKQRVGKLSYAKPIWRGVMLSPARLDVSIDGATVSAYWLIVTSASRYGGSFRLTRRMGLSQKGLLAILLKRGDRVSRIRALAAIASGRLDRLAEKAPELIAILPCERVSVHSVSPAACQIDGDGFGTTPLDIVRGRADLELIVPAGWHDESHRQPGVIRIN